MHRSLFLVFFIVFFGFIPALWAQSMPETGPNLAESNLGSISFYLDKKHPNTQGESVQVTENTKVYFCLQLNTKVPDLKAATDRLMQVDMTLMGEGDLPQKIRALSKLTENLIQANALSCWAGSFTIPLATPAGKYRVAELDLLMASGHKIFLRDHIDQFQPRGLVNVDSPIKDATPPVIEKIKSWTPLFGEMNMRYSRAWQSIYFRVVATDEMVGIDPNSFQIFFKVFVDGELIDIIRPRCIPRLANLYYDCTLYFSRAEHDFYGRTLKLVLDSIGVADKHGNWKELTTPEQLMKIFNGKLLQYTFYTHKVPKSESQPDPNGLNKNDHDVPSARPRSPHINRLRPY